MTATEVRGRWSAVMGWRLAHLPVLLAASGVLLVAASVLGWLLRGGAGAVGAAAGVGVVTASYLVSTLAIAWADSVDPQLVLPVGMGMYAIKFSMIGFGMVAVTATGWAGLEPMGVGVVAGVIVWTATQIWWVVRHPPRLDYTPPTTPPGGADGSTARY